MPHTTPNNEPERADGLMDEATNLPVCFVIQPFDKGKFDKRFRDDFEPALKDAGFEAYRVDEDPTPDVLIDAIEEGIRLAPLVLADVTKDNPNVWYELGYAFALSKPVILTCEDGRRLPFDIQHRHVIHYQTESGSDFARLRRQITERAEALRTSAFERQVREADPVALQDGLTQRGIHLLGLVAGATHAPGSRERVWELSRKAGVGGLTEIAVGLAFRELSECGLILTEEVEDERDDYTYNAVHVTTKGWDWIRQHDHLFLPPPPPADDFEDDIPY